MDRRTSLFLLTLPAALAADVTASAAQEGRIAFRRTVAYEFEVPERWGDLGDRIPTGDVTDMLLLFNASESVMVPVPETANGAATGRSGRAERIAARLRASSASRTDQETLLASYASFADGTLIETREFMGRRFRIAGPRPTYGWKLSGEQRGFLGYTVQKATAAHEGSNIEAWFTPDIPVAAGPGPFGGLPGMILVVTVDEGRTVYAATDVALAGTGDGVIAPPERGDEVSREEYERIVAEKLEELRTLESGRGRPPF